ncbi:hypothetical protein [Marispirochaeta sp.]|uniref:hypothetical protein n=1 Tax=Marispirochaeta sp. TaxID=2038653 RepID=UPI0029C8AA8D|nr:hypothetical protein [Marispirochaeta sp.]
MQSRNIDQWDEVYPARADIEQDIAAECAFGFFSDDRLTGYVALNESYDPEYDALRYTRRIRAVESPEN